MHARLTGEWTFERARLTKVETMKAFLLASASATVLWARAVAIAAPAAMAHPSPSLVTRASVGDTDSGFLDVSSEPSGAKILIDDADLGQTTPQHHLPVKTGHHRLTLVAADGSRKLTVGFTIEAGQTKKLTLYLAK
jgi:hypothetical protein